MPSFDSELYNSPDNKSYDISEPAYAAEALRILNEGHKALSPMPVGCEYTNNTRLNGQRSFLIHRSGDDVFMAEACRSVACSDDRMNAAWHTGAKGVGRTLNGGTIKGANAEG